MNKKVRFSNHAVWRFKERFPEIIKEYNGNKLLAISMTYRNSAINNRIKNDTSFMTYVYGEHGYDEFELYINRDVVFLIKNDTMVTVMKTDMRLGNKIVQNNSRFHSTR